MRVLANILAYVAFVHCIDQPVLLRSGPCPPSPGRRYARTKSAHGVRGLLRVSSDQTPGPRSWPRLAWQWRRARWARCVLMLLSWPRSSDHPGCRGQARTVRWRCRRHNGCTSLRPAQQRSCRSRRPPRCLPGGAVRLARPQTRAEPGTPLSGPRPPRRVAEYRSSMRRRSLVFCSPDQQGVSKLSCAEQLDPAQLYQQRVAASLAAHSREVSAARIDWIAGRSSFRGHRLPPRLASAQCHPSGSG